MTKLNTLLSAMLAVALVAGPSLAAGTSSAGKAMGSPAGGNYTEKQLVGLNVFDSTGAHFGYIKGVNQDESTGNINYVIVAKGNTSGTEYAVSTADLAINSDERTASLLVPDYRVGILEPTPVQVSCVSDRERVMKNILEE